jgi:hypothetical protein
MTGPHRQESREQDLFQLSFSLSLSFGSNAIKKNQLRYYFPKGIFVDSRAPSRSRTETSVSGDGDKAKLSRKWSLLCVHVCISAYVDSTGQNREFSPQPWTTVKAVSRSYWRIIIHQSNRKPGNLYHIYGSEGYVSCSWRQVSTDPDRKCTPPRLDNLNNCVVRRM